MRVFSALLLSLSLLSGLQQQHKKTNQSRNSGTTDHLGTQDSPLFVKVLPAPKTQEETERENNDRNEKVANDRNLVNATYVLAGIGVLQLFVFGYQALKLKQTVQSATEQSEAMERSIAEAARSASAMEKVAVDIERSASMRRLVVSSNDLARRDFSVVVLSRFISGFYSHSGESVGLGACWCPIVMKRCCNLTYGLVFQAKRLSAVAATRDLHPVIARSCRLGFRPALWSNT